MLTDPPCHPGRLLGVGALALVWALTTAVVPTALRAQESLPSESPRHRPRATPRPKR